MSLPQMAIAYKLRVYYADASIGQMYAHLIHLLGAHPHFASSGFEFGAACDLDFCSGEAQQALAFRVAYA